MILLFHDISQSVARYVRMKFIVPAIQMIKL